MDQAVKRSSQGDSRSRIDQMLVNLRNRPAFKSLVPMEAGIGWAIPYKSKGHIYAIFPLFGVSSPSTTNQKAIFPPFATMTLEWQTGRIVEYVDFRFRSRFGDLDLSKPVGIFPHPEVAGLSITEFKQKRDELLHLYDVFFDALALDGALPPFWLQQFRDRLSLLLEPSLKPFYQVLGNKFYTEFLE